MNRNLKLILLLSFLVFIPAVTNFFSADDWFHLRLAQIESFRDFLNFFSFTRNPQSASFYRPLPTQFFFFIFHFLFSLNASPYYLFVLLSFIYSLYLLYHFTKKLTKKEVISLTTTIFYGFSVTNFTRLYFLSAFQEIALVIFSLLVFINHLDNKKIKSLLFFILALMSKETAVVIPAIVFLLDWSKKQFNPAKVLPFLIILAPYLYLRLFIFGISAGDTYIWNFSPKTTLNTLFWYVLWSLGAPELLVDYIGSGLRPIPRFFTDFPIFSYLTLSLIASALLAFIINAIRHINQIKRIHFFAGFLFVISLSPVIFLPQHKFTLELGLPLVGFALLLALMTKLSSWPGKLFLISFLILNLSMNYLTFTRHYSVRRSNVARNLYEYLQHNHPKAPSKSLYFTNPSQAGPHQDFSKQLSLVTSQSDMFKVFYQNQEYQVFYQSTEPPPPSTNTEQIQSAIFFK